MALINCPDCGKEVSDKVTNCIHCGFPIGKQIDEFPKKRKSKKGLIILLSFLCLILLTSTTILSIYILKLDKVNKKSTKAKNEMYSNNKSNSLSDQNSKILDENNDYVTEYLKIESEEVAMCDGLLGKEPGLRNIQVRNNGVETVNELTIAVSFFDNDGKIVAEKLVTVIGGIYSGDSLKPNFAWRLDSDKYFPLENLASDIDLMRYKIRIYSAKID